MLWMPFHLSPFKIGTQSNAGGMRLKFPLCAFPAPVP